MLSLISPAKSQDFKTKAPTTKVTQPIFKGEIETLVHQLKHYEPAEFESLMKISPKLASGVFEMYVDFDPESFTTQNAKQAMFAFSGDVYRGLDANSLTEKEIDFAENHLLMISGLYGFLRPLDLLQAYRLEMGTKISIDGISLYAFWRDKLTQFLNKTISAHKHKVIVNLASNEYSKAIDKKNLQAEWLDIDFKEYHKDKYQTIALYAKKARGMMVRYILDHKIEDQDALKGFNYGGYQYNPQLSHAKNLCFSRVKP
ncbi:peroxide stress protein YaaA [Fangia hongkongensis]|uniref:peroxide stress protein YaaA n=1 Tax=Fangia hongkongensis TaxID=270495 RepID=UPI0003666D74|nr:peroxide stress protein YaaA [Fangia hongkongensis]MBK2125269.1 peroxide stress protein YaaA [Fangia hongkongensis]